MNIGYRKLFWLGLFLLGLMPLSNGQEIDGESIDTHEKLVAIASRWLMAVEQHEPGESDMAANTVGSWPASSVKKVICYIEDLAKLKRSNTLRRSETDQSLADLFPEEEASLIRRFMLNPNRILKLGALLHSDIAMLKLDTGRTDLPAPLHIIIDDGHAAHHSGGLHWEFSRKLLNWIFLDPSADEMVRQWYVSVTAFMLAHRQWGYADTNLEFARRLFPKDAMLLFYLGVLHETYASPEIQSIRERRFGVRAGIGSKKSELKKAKKFFNKSMEADPEIPEVQLHLGRVMGLLGDHDKAVVELRLAAEGVRNSLLQYYCSLYIGHELALLNRREEARKQFEHAAMLYPTAQSPLLSLSHLARNSGNFEDAVITVQQVFRLPAGDNLLEDPWWLYSVSAVRNASALISEMYRTFGELR